MDPRDPAFAIGFIESELVFSEGSWTGKPARLEPWQKQEVRDLLRRGQNGKRKHDRGLLGVARRNGKSQLAGWLASYFACADGEPSPLVVVAAATDHQADVVFRMARRAIELGPLAPVAEFYEREVIIRSTPGAPGRIRRVACTTGDVLGASIHAAILDELHDWRGPRAEEVYAGIVGGTGARTEPLILAISTAGYDQDTICGRLYRHGKAVEAGKAKDPAFYFRWFEAPNDAPLRSKKAWKAANPNIGITIPDPDRYIAQQVATLRESEVRRWNHNSWTVSEETAFSPGVWDACRQDGAKLEDGAGIVIGLDGSPARGEASLVACTTGDDEPTLFLLASWQTPEHDPKWRLHTQTVRDALQDALGRYYVSALVANPREWADLLVEAEEEGVSSVEFPPTPQRLATSWSRFEAAVHEQRVAHDGDPRLARHIESLVVKSTPEGIRPDRPSRPGLFDSAARAALLAFDQAAMAPATDYLW